MSTAPPELFYIPHLMNLFGVVGVGFAHHTLV